MEKIKGNYNLMFSFLSFISGLCEIGMVIWGMKFFGITGALIGAICYQIGNLIPNPIGLSKRMCWLLLCISAVFGLAGLFQPVFLYPAVTLFTLVLQNERAYLKNKTRDTGSKVLKRLTRIFGFACGCVFGTNVFLLCLTIVFIHMISKKECGKTIFCIPHFNKLDGILILHEVHYFVYCYSILILIYNLNIGGNPIAGYSSFAFALSWIPYAMVPNIYKKPKILSKLGYKKTFLIGHSILAIILVSMFCIFKVELNSEVFPFVSLIIWFLTGIGGTTEFCIEEIDKQSGTYIKNNHNSAENIGHFLGVILSIILWIIVRDLSISILVAGVFAFAALILMGVFVKEETK